MGGEGDAPPGAGGLERQAEQHCAERERDDGGGRTESEEERGRHDSWCRDRLDRGVCAEGNRRPCATHTTIRLRTYVRSVCACGHTSHLPRPVGPACTVAAMERRRIDTLLAERGLAGSRTSAAESVRAGRVRIGPDGPRATKPGQLVESDVELLVDGERRYVSRGGLKLEHALERLDIDVS